MWDTNIKLVEVVTVADVDAEDRFGNSLLKIWELRFGSKAKLLFRPWAQGSAKILKIVQARFFSSCVSQAHWPFDTFQSAYSTFMCLLITWPFYRQLICYVMSRIHISQLKLHSLLWSIYACFSQIFVLTGRTFQSALPSYLLHAARIIA